MTDTMSEKLDVSEITPDKEDWIDFGRIHGPKWKDQCGHGGYIATYEICEDPKRGMDVYDLYVWDDHGKQSVCLRFGNEGSDYYSPGGLVNLIQNSHLMPSYRSAVGLLQKLGKIKWEMSQTPPDSI